MYQPKEDEQQQQQQPLVNSTQLIPQQQIQQLTRKQVQQHQQTPSQQQVRIVQANGNVLVGHQQQETISIAVAPPSTSSQQQQMAEVAYVEEAGEAETAVDVEEVQVMAESEEGQEEESTVVVMDPQQSHFRIQGENVVEQESTTFNIQQTDSNVLHERTTAAGTLESHIVSQQEPAATSMVPVTQQPQGDPVLYGQLPVQEQYIKQQQQQQQVQVITEEQILHQMEDTEEEDKDQKTNDILNSPFIKKADFNSQLYYNWLSSFAEQCKMIVPPLATETFGNISFVHKTLSDVLASPTGILSNRNNFLILKDLSSELYSIINQHLLVVMENLE